MNEIGAQLLYERHPSVHGVYADLSSGVPEYYVKCPECGHVHGMFGSVQDAVNNKVCGACQFDRIQDFKAQLEKVNDRPKVKPGKKRKLPWPLATESLNEDEFDELNADDLIALTPEKTWVEKAAIELAENDRVDPDDIVFTNEPDDSDEKVEVDIGRRTYTLYKDEDLLRSEVVKQVSEQIWDDPSNFADWLVQKYIDEDRLRQIINSGMDENDVIPDDHSPWDWLEGIYGRGDALKQAVKMVNIDAQGMAEECVRIDGWRHFYSGDRVVELADGVIATF